MANFRVELPKIIPLSGWRRDIRAGHELLIMRSPIVLNAKSVSQ